MALKPGYKQTEVGVIPEDWEVMTVGDIAIVGSGGTPNRKNPDFWGGDIPWITTTQIDGGEIKSAEQYITKSGFESSAAKWYLRGTILMAMYGQGKTRGKTAVLGIDATINQACAAITVSDTVNKKYLLHYLIGCYDKIRELSNSGGQENLNSNIVKSIKVIVPTKTEQTAIANALSDADALIQSLTRLIAKKRQIKQGAMQTLLNPYENGRLKAGWVLKKLGDSCEMFSGGTPNTAIASYYGGDVQWITSGDLNKGKITEVEGRITKVGLINSSAKTISQDTLLLALYGATSGVVAISKINAAINQAVLAIIPDGSLKNVFLFYILTYLKDWIIATYTQGGQPNLSGNIIKSLELYCPDVDEQGRIATILSDMDAEIAALETKLAKYRHIKQGMMQNLLTGRIRLVKPESKTGAVA